LLERRGLLIVCNNLVLHDVVGVGLCGVIETGDWELESINDDRAASEGKRQPLLSF
jgi:hypothetical protein